MEYLVGSVEEFSGDDRKIMTVDGERIVVFGHRGEMFALSATCKHQGGSVGEGVVLGKVEGVVDAQGRYLGDTFSEEIAHIVCPWHGWAYDIRTGKAAGLPSVGLKTYPVEVRDGKVYVDV